MHQTKSKWRTFGRKFMRKKFNIMKMHAGLKNGTHKTQAWNGTHYVKKMSQRH
jgi:hypothetical protein